MARMTRGETEAGGRGGEVAWKRPLSGGNNRQRKQNMSTPSPVTDGTNVWVMTGTGILKAFDFAGTELWARDIQKDYGRFGLNWGYASSALLHDDSLYVQVLHGMKTDDPSYVLRIDKKSGKTMWKVERPTDRAPHRSLHGLSRTLVANMVQGVSDGFEKRLELVGVGYRAQLKGKDLEIAAGFSHPVIVAAPDGITFDCPQPTQIVVHGIDKSLVGQTAADIRKVRPPEPYKGKGIKYDGEVVRRKVGKRA